MASDFGIVVHGGAGSLGSASLKDIRDRRRTLKESAEAGYAALEKGKDSVLAVENAVKVMEDSGVFNAGRGASLTLEGKMSLDAAIMRGNLQCGAIGDANVVKNPISLARQVMERSDHVLMVGNENLMKFARAVGMEIRVLSPSPARLARCRKDLLEMKKGKIDAWPKNYELKSYMNREMAKETSDTIGAVAIDRKATFCAGVSTGGRWLKLPGRVGDSALIGAGIYADNSSGAACATGLGEDIIRVVLCKSVCDFMKMGSDAQSACDAAIASLTRVIGPGIAGVIAVDRFGRYGSSRNTEVLPRAFLFSSMKKTIVAVLPHELDPVSKMRAPREKLPF